MNLKNNTCRRICVLYLLLLTHVIDGSIFDYFPLGNSLFGKTATEDENAKELTTQKVLYEVEVTDEKFIEQAAKFTGVSLSDLDKCQHRVVLKLQDECHKLNDEDLAKLAVKLLNCQSAIEGRKIYPCTNDMAIRDCTSNMDPDTWNSYLLMSNRARAVCYSIRQAQFRGLTELTVNKLMGAAHEQLEIMTKLKDSQFRIEQSTSDTYNSVVKGNAVLKRQQDDLRQAQFYGQLALEDNIRRLADEKQLILEGHEQLAEMTKDVKAKLDDAARQLDSQAEERKDNHKEILNDLIAIQEQAQVIFARIEDSSRHMLEQSALAAKQYEATLTQLTQVNSTVYALVDVVTSTRLALEEKMKWMSEALGGTDDAVERLYLCLSHISYLVLAMVSCAFLQVAVPSRVALVVLVPLNLVVAIQQGTEQALTFVGLSAVLLSFIAVQTILSLGLSFWNSRSLIKPALQQNENSSISAEAADKTLYEEQEECDDSVKNYESSRTASSARSYSLYANGYRYRRYPGADTTDNHSEIEENDDFPTMTPPLSRNGISRSRSKTPSVISLGKRRCHATTRMGTPCKSSAVIGRDFCYRHQSGSSVIQ